jgi:hypothetical protein
VLSSRRESGTVIDADGRQHHTLSYWLLPEVVRLIKPSRVAERDAGFAQRICRADVGETIQFAYRFNDYFDAAVALGQRAASQGVAVPWLENLPLKSRDARGRGES